jgi:hypothetical protein
MVTSTRIIKLIKKAARELHKGMPTGGLHGTKKGKKGYSRKEKHKHANNRKQSDN